MKFKKIVYDLVPYGIMKKKVEKTYAIGDGSCPKVFDAEGNEYKWVYCQDELGKHLPHKISLGLIPKYFLINKDNYLLDIHLYGHYDIFKTKGKPKIKIALLVESVSVLPDLYKKITNNKTCLESFDVVFTNQQIILDNFSNARWINGFDAWYGTSFGGGVINCERFNLKNKLVSICASKKKYNFFTKLRFDTAIKCKEDEKIDTFGDFDEGRIVKCNEYLDDYMFSIQIENQISHGYFTQKITDCFLAMTVPIYIGDESIFEFFNKEGIILIKKYDVEEILNVVSKLSEEDYFKRKEAILDNFERAKNYRSTGDYIYENYKYLFE